MKKGELFNISGTQYNLVDWKLKQGQYIVICEPWIQADTKINVETNKLLDELHRLKHSKVQASEKVVDWFLTVKAKLRQNSTLLFSVKKPKFASELRRIMLEHDESWHDIISVLNYSLTDKFWSENLINCYKNLSGKTASGVPVYFQIKSKLEAETATKQAPIYSSGENDNDL